MAKRSENGGLTPPEVHAAMARLREEIARRRISRQALADKARISLSTLEKGLSGRRPFTLATLVRIEDALGVSLRLLSSTANAALANGISATAPDELGNYSRASVAWIIGSHLTLRPSFGDPRAVYAFRTDIAWDETTSRLVFREAERVDQDFTQFGTVSVPQQSGHIYLVTNRHGQYRLTVVARPTITGEMHGLVTTLRAGMGAHLSPVATPIVLKPISNGERHAFGRIASGHAAYASYRALLKRTLDEHYASLLGL